MIKYLHFLKKSKSVDDNNNTKEATIKDLSNSTSIRIDKIKFSDLEEKDYYPALVTLGIKGVDDGTPDHSWNKFDSWLKKVNMISGRDLIAVHVISDNVKGDKGLSVNVLEFSPGTKINSGMRLAYGENIKWPKDFIQNYSSWYISGY